MAAPRSFALRADEVSEAIERRQRAALATSTARGTGPWQRLRGWWQSGSPLWRNAAATSLAVFLALILVEQAAPFPLRQTTGEAAVLSQPAPAANVAAETEADEGAAVVEQSAADDAAAESDAAAVEALPAATSQTEELAAEESVEESADAGEAVSVTMADADLMADADEGMTEESTTGGEHRRRG